MYNQELVSVIMIFFNEEKFIEEAIASVLAQIFSFPSGVTMICRGAGIKDFFTTYLSYI